MAESATETTTQQSDATLHNATDRALSRDDERPVSDDGPDLVARANTSARSRIRRQPGRSQPTVAEEVLQRGHVAHVAYALDGQPYVLPFTYHYEDGTIYLHGAHSSRTLATLRNQTPVCVEITLLDGLVASRDAKSHSANYRSVVVFGTAVRVSDEDQKRAIFERMTLRYFPDRVAGRDYLHARSGELRATELLAVAVDELGAKTRTGPPHGAHDGPEDGLGTRYVVVLPERSV